MAVISLPNEFILNYSQFLFFFVFYYIWKFYCARGHMKNNETTPAHWDTLLTPNVNLVGFYIVWQLFFIFTAKTCRTYHSFVHMNLTLFLLIFFFVLITFLFFLKRSNKFRPEDELHLNGLMWINFMIVIFMLVTDFISFILVLELIAAGYLFFILVFLRQKELTLLKLKNMVSNYLWVSFFTLIIIFFAMLLVVRAGGSLQFSELYVVSKFGSFYAWQLLLVGLLWKIGSPGFYFFKLEIYQYLPTKSLIFFSIASAFVSCFLLHFIFINCWPVFVYQQTSLIIYLTVYNTLMLIRGLKNLTFYQFLALSAANTWSVLLLFYLI